MSSIVLELQKDAINNAIPITDLLRKALIVARKLKQSSFTQWIENESNGYYNNSDIPKYRIIYGEVKIHNIVHGWIPVKIDPKFQDTFSKTECPKPISEIEYLLNPEKVKSSFVYMQFVPAQQQILKELSGCDHEYCLVITKSSLFLIIESVRNTILNWALKLEEDKILGEGILFSLQEKELAANQNYSINNFYGDASNMQIQQSPINSIQNIYKAIDIENISKLMKLIDQEKDNINIGKDEIVELNSDMVTVNSQIISPKPKVKIIEESLKSIRTILESAGGTVAANLIIELGKYMQ